MKIAIISDSHDNIPNLKKAIDFIKKEKIKTILHCGDVCAPATLKEVFSNFKGKVYIVFGNVDGDHFNMTKLSFEKLSDVKILGEIGELTLGGKKIAFTHYPKFAKGLAATGNYDIVFYGHSHKPWEEKINNTKLVNPGNLAGIFYKPTFAIYNTKTGKLELKILQNLKPNH